MYDINDNIILIIIDVMIDRYVNEGSSLVVSSGIHVSLFMMDTRS